MNKSIFLVGVLILGIGLGGCSKLGIKEPELKPPTTESVTETAKTVKETIDRSAECEKFRDPIIAIEEEKAIGATIAVGFVSKGGGLVVSRDPANKKANELALFVNYVGKNLAAQSARPGLAWTFGVLKSDEFNAYSAPGGYVLVTTGLLGKLENEAQLAGVLAHEIAHITERHALRVYTSIKANQCQVALAAGAAGELASQFVSFDSALKLPGGFIDLADVANFDLLAKMADDLVDKITTQGYAHDDEYASDRIAAETILAAGYKPTEYKKVISMIPSDGGAFSHHPTNADRITKLAEWENAAKQRLAEEPFATDPAAKDLKAGKLPAAVKGKQ